MNHMLLGALIPFLAAIAVYTWRGFRASIPLLIITPVFMTMTMTWAVAPDLPRLFGMTDLYYTLMREPRCDIFFWHYSIDKIETASAWYPALFVLMWALLLFAAWRELFLREKEN